MTSTSVVIDTSVLSTRPEISDIKEFLDKKLRVDWSRVKSVQLHNIKNIVLLGLENEADAKRLAHMHHLMHRISCAGKELPILIPIYEKSRAVDVRIHDLDKEIGDEAIKNYLRQFGEVLSIRDEVWKNFFPGLSNGVRVVRMIINQPIPAHATIEDQITLVSYKGQPRYCKGCGGKPHPKLRCHEAATNRPENASQIINSEEFPALPIPANNPNNNSPPSTSSPVPPPPPKITDDNCKQQDNNRAQMKRQLSTETSTSTSKKTNNKGEREYDPYLDPHVYFTELYNSSYMDNFKDENERKKALFEIAERVVKLRREDLKRDLETKNRKK